MIEEIWRDIIGFEGICQVSNKGNIKTLPRVTNSFQVTKSDGSVYTKVGRKVKGAILQPQLRGNYPQVSVNINAKKYLFTIHREVAKAFLVDSYFEGACVNHIDENKLNNVVENLEWVSYSENINHGTCIQRITESQSNSVKQIDLDTGEVLKIWSSTREANRKGGFSSGCISKVCNGKQSHHKGYFWAYVDS
jgi:hypothetical protein